MSDVVSKISEGGPRPSPSPALRRSADWGGKALLVFALALLMAIPGVFVFALIADREQRADEVVQEVSRLQGGAQQVAGPLLVAPWFVIAKDGKVEDSGLYEVSPQEGSAKVRVRASTLHRGLFDVPVYNAVVDLDATFAPPPKTANLPAQARIDWSQAQIVVGFSDLRGAKADVTGAFAGASAASPMVFAPASNLGLGEPVPVPTAADGPARAAEPGVANFGLVAAPASALVASPTGGRFTAQLRFTGAQRISVLPFAKSTRVSIAGDGASPSFDGGFLPETRSVQSGAFQGDWTVPFMARGLSDHGPASALNLDALGKKDLGVTFVRTNNPYQNVMRALKYAVMFVGLVFLTFFVFEALSGRRLHPAQYVLVGLAQMVFYLLLLSLSEYLGFDVAFAGAAVATVALIGLYAGAAFRSGAYRVRALAIFSVVYALIYLLMRLDDFALLAGSVASFIGLALAMFLTRNIDWYGGRATPAEVAAAGTPLAS